MKEYVLITGGTRGIGKAVASCLGEAGYPLALTYASDEENACRTKEELARKYGVDVHVLQADSTDRASIDNIYMYLEKQDIKLGAVVLNAGITCRDSFEEMTLEDWEKVFFANVHFPVFLLQRIVGLIGEGGCVVFTGSLMGIQPHAVSLSYGVTKSAVHSLVRNLMKSFVPYKIRVNGVAPGFVDTEWQRNKPAEIRRNIENKIALGRFCEPEELARVYKMLIENTYLNGEVVVVDGGYSYK
ncbi:MAG: SDR family oxidoreductase [Tannerellaceae bacterium]|jgi:3-oxoacyl-[acyl-carrier protein] reductase|nr:SDR family oxidoreductase [Tannerellaceae bacterium]